MKHGGTRVSRYASFTRRVAETLVILLFSAVLTLQLLNILFRYTQISTPWMWVGELTRYAFIWIVFLLWHLADRTGSHYSVDLLSGKLSFRSTTALGVGRDVVALLFAGAVIWGSVRYIPTTMLYQTDSFRWLPMGIVHLVMPIGLSLAVVERLFGIADKIRTAKGNRDE